MTAPLAPVRAFLVDDHEVVLHGLTEYLATRDNIEVVGTSTTPTEALELIEQLDPDVALLDVRLPEMDGITLCREIRTRCRSTRCLMLSTFGTETALVDAIVAGASGYLLKEAPLSEVADAIVAVGGGRSLLDPQMTELILGRLRDAREEDEAMDRLTAQERHVLDLMAQGLSNREISERLFLAEQTVKNYVSNVLSKLGMQRRTQAAIYAATRAASDSRPTEAD